MTGKSPSTKNSRGMEAVSIKRPPIAPEQGQSLVEFAFSLVIILLLIVGIVDVGRALFVYIALRDSAQEGALYGSIEPTDTASIRARVANSSNTLQELEANGDLQVDVAYTTQPCGGHAITVQVHHTNFEITMPFLGAIIGRQTVVISAQAIDTILTPACTSP